ncbi:hypothetical protein N7444_008407 [Penicillium canescens]|nr:hypothetical protein N7444_008407 [Penicillium canescens]
MDTKLGAKIIRELKDVATVDVETTGTRVSSGNVIVVDVMKLRKVMCGYDYLREIVHKTWSDLPPPPMIERAQVVVWLIVCNNYCINHSTIKWPGSSPNTYVHLWSIMDRIKTSLTNIDANWLVDRGYGDEPGAADVRERGEDFDSFYDFHMSTFTPKQKEVFNVSMLNLSQEMRDIYLSRRS